MSQKERYPERNALIRKMRSEGMTYYAIGRVLGMIPGNVYKVCHPDQARRTTLKIHNSKYGIDDDYTEKIRQRSREYYARKKAERQQAEP